MNKNRQTIPSSYWRYTWRKLNGKIRYVKVKKVNGKVKIRIAKRRK